MLLWRVGGCSWGWVLFVRGGYLGVCYGCAEGVGAGRECGEVSRGGGVAGDWVVILPGFEIWDSTVQKDWDLMMK